MHARRWQWNQRRSFSRLIGHVVLLAAAACGDPTRSLRTSAADVAAPERGTNAITAQTASAFIVVLNPDVRSATDAVAAIQRIARETGVRPARTYTTAMRGFTATLDGPDRVALVRHPLVAYVEPDAVTRKAAVGVRSLPVAQWGLDRIDQRGGARDWAYGFANQGEGVEVHIVDTGVRASHAEFGGRVRSLYDWVDGDINADDCDGHGTHVAGTAAGATVGVAGRATVYASRVLGCDGTGTWSQVLSAVDSITKRRVANPGVPVVGNLSLGAPGITQSVIDAIENSSAVGVAWVVAAGNDNGGDACLVTPAAAPSALTVGASTSADARAPFSNIGPCVDLFAPGQSITSSTIDGGFGVLSGTSMAAPHVAGVAALALAAEPTASASRVHQLLTTTATANVLSDVGSTTPNRVVYSHLATGAITPVPGAYVLTTAVSGNGSVTATGISCSSTGGDCTETLASGTAVTVTPAAAVGSVFSGWTGDCTGTGACTVSLTRARAVGATFAELPAMHVGDLEAVKSVTSKSWTVTLTVLVHDRSELPVSGAAVTVAMSGGTTGTLTCTTGTAGTCVVKAPSLSNAKTSLTFTMRTVTKTGWDHLATANHDVTINSTGSSITVYR